MMRALVRLLLVVQMESELWSSAALQICGQMGMRFGISWVPGHFVPTVWSHPLWLLFVQDSHSKRKQLVDFAKMELKLSGTWGSWCLWKIYIQHRLPHLVCVLLSTHTCRECTEELAAVGTGFCFNVLHVSEKNLSITCPYREDFLSRQLWNAPLRTFY